MQLYDFQLTLIYNVVQRGNRCIQRSNKQISNNEQILY